MRPAMEPDQIAEQLSQLRAREQFLRQALATENKPAQLARFYVLFRDVRDRILEMQAEQLERPYLPR